MVTRCLLLTWAVAALCIGSYGLRSGPAHEVALRDVKAGSGICYWNDYPACPGPAGMCSGCDAAHKCEEDSAELWQNYYYSECVNSTSGLLECGFPFTTYCHYQGPCDDDCEFGGGMWYCVRSVDENDEVIENDATPKESTSASGDFCYSA